MNLDYLWNWSPFERSSKTAFCGSYNQIQKRKYKETQCGWAWKGDILTPKSTPTLILKLLWPLFSEPLIRHENFIIKAIAYCFSSKISSEFTAEKGKKKYGNNNLVRCDGNWTDKETPCDWAWKFHSFILNLQLACCKAGELNDWKETQCDWACFCD